jgi:hypothetical protein
MHFVTNEGELGMLIHISVFAMTQFIGIEEILIGFDELIGAHSGENMAASVFKLLDIYGLKDKVRFIVNVSFMPINSWPTLDHCRCR